jgi:hypothetical protein
MCASFKSYVLKTPPSPSRKPFDVIVARQQLVASIKSDTTDRNNQTQNKK